METTPRNSWKTVLVWWTPRLLAAVTLILIFVSPAIVKEFAPDRVKATPTAPAPLTAEQQVVAEKVAACRSGRVRCLGGYARIMNGRPYPLRQIGATLDFGIIRISDLDRPTPVDLIILPDDPEWEQAAVAYARQFLQELPRNTNTPN